MNWLDEYENLKLPPLERGSHNDPSAGLCAMEMVAFIERLPHSDSPPCTCPVLAAYTRRLNDLMHDDVRQSLLRLLHRLVGTASPSDEKARAELLAMRAVNVFAPVALEAAGMHQHANICRKVTLSDAAYAASAAASAASAAYAASASAAAAYAANAASAAYAAYAASASAAAAYAAARVADAAVWPLAVQALEDAISLGPTTGFTKSVPVDELAKLHEEMVWE